MSNYIYTAIIIEPRKHKALDFVIRNVCKCLSENWKIILFHGYINEEYSKNIIEKINNEFNEKVQMVNINICNLNSVEYSKFFANKNQ